MIDSGVLSLATQSVMSGVQKARGKSETAPSRSTRETVNKETETSMEQATCKCPSCEEMTPVTEVYMLAPNEEHTESCTKCGQSISMKYDENGDWHIHA